MNYLCLNCGYINNNTETVVCEICNIENDLEQYQKFSEYAKQAVQYGYSYRTAYEHQLATQGDVKVRYSIFNPDDYYELLAIAALSGIAGNLAYDLVKHVAKQIYTKLIKKEKDVELTYAEQDLLRLIDDNAFMNKFIVYIQDYYQGMPNIDKRISKAIFDEEINPIIARLITNETKMNKLKDDVENGKDFKIAYFQLLMSEAQNEFKKRPGKPKLKELDSTLKKLKKEIKQPKNKRKRK
ncbi:hypothetical protein [Rufibacter tibetensis]|uniref:Uncharacterized protein n=1 Tax=Rufibacter tibetensis TaxID=512763 RepID=A0A0P0CXZ4_9BACT|nr:hypothetical protein [Rufibacter tibetensis]ALJ01677.1 hypothetical protein DC20_21730 [Rufibacter tibetensis]